MHFSPVQPFILAVSCSAWLVLALTGAPAPKPAFPAFFAFGDSILDTGNNNLLPTIAKCNFPPYGKDFIGHEPTGRFSNGKVPSDFLASRLGIKELLPPYLSPRLSSEDLLTGVCFASGSSGYDNLTSDILSVISLQDQLELFKQYKEKLLEATDPGRAATIIKESLYAVCSGSNDFANTYFSTLMRRAFYDVPTYAGFLVDSATTFVEELYNLGARKIVVVGLPPIGCLPAQRTLAGGIQRDCVSSYNHAAIKYNIQLAKMLQVLQKKLPGATIVYADIYDKLLRLIQTPSAYGFEEVGKGCCGTGVLELGPLCNGKSSMCDDDSKYVFWDSFHPTQKAYRILVDEIIQEYLRLLL